MAKISADMMPQYVSRLGVNYRTRAKRFLEIKMTKYGKKKQKKNENDDFGPSIKNFVIFSHFINV